MTGTTSWAGDEWSGALFPAGTPPEHRLIRYAERFRAVEAGTTYFRTPSARTVRRWAAQVPEGFEFSPRFPRSVCPGAAAGERDPSKILDPEASAPAVHEFLSAMLELGAAAGPLLLQVPYLKRSVLPNSKAFAEKLDRFLSALPPDFRYAVEVRNHRWIDAGLLDVLRRHSAALVLLDRVHAPHFDEIPKRFDLLPATFTYLRLLGEGRARGEGSSPEGRPPARTEDRIRRWARLLEPRSADLGDVYVFMDRTYAPDAVAALRRIERLLSHPSATGD